MAYLYVLAEMVAYTSGVYQPGQCATDTCEQPWVHSPSVLAASLCISAALAALHAACLCVVSRLTESRKFFLVAADNHAMVSSGGESALAKQLVGTSFERFIYSLDCQ